MEGQRLWVSCPCCLGTNWACRALLAPGKAPDLELSGLLGTPCIQAAGGHCPLHAPNTPCTHPSVRSWGCAASERTPLNKPGGEGTAPHPALAWGSAPCPPSRAQHLPGRAMLVECPEQPHPGTQRLGVRSNPPSRVGHGGGPHPGMPCPSSSIKAGGTIPRRVGHGKALP